MLNARLMEMTDHTFRRLATLLDPVQPRINLPPIRSICFCMSRTTRRGSRAASARKP